MESNHIDRLTKAYPELYGNVYCGFFVGNGWIPLVEQLSKDLVKYCKENNCPVPTVAQVKEKFGGLRYYIDGMGIPQEHFTIINDMIHTAEERSFKICESCGKPGRESSGGWIKTFCSNCEGNRYKPKS